MKTKATESSIRSALSKGRPLVLALVAVCCTVCSCLGSETAPRHRYYRLPIHKNLDRAEETLPVVYRVEEFEVAPAYDHLRIVYRVSPFELRHYGYRQWVTKPGRLVADSIREYAELSGHFRTVTEGPTPVADYTVQGRVDVIEEVDKKKHWFAHMVLSLRLIRSSDGKILWSSRFDETVRVKKRRPKHIVAGLTKVLRKATEKLISTSVELIRKDRAGKE
jgi:ABC-type uncharacterized transport system auxiliary subunit